MSFRPRRIPIKRVNEAHNPRRVNIIKSKNNIKIVNKDGQQHQQIDRRVDRPKQPNQPLAVARKQHNIKIIKAAKAGRASNQPIRAKPIISSSVDVSRIQKIKDVGIGRILVMIACGPSVLEVDFSPIKNQDNVDIMVINKPLKQVWPAKYWAFCDHSQYLRNTEVFDSYSGTIITSNGVRARAKNAEHIVITAIHKTGVSRDLRQGYVIGRSSVYANLQTALWMNYDKIFVFGVDMCKVDGKLHHYGKNPDVDDKIRQQRFDQESKNYNRMADTLPESIRQRIYFCSSYNPYDFVRKFNKINHLTAIKMISSL